ncbi:MAG: SurA N-terminal domain-containing protein [Alphaproteobacteria bacterium]|nr:SurA N-terminal domain-containing protein [Alphaproteobacteria bacterium]
MLQTIRTLAHSWVVKALMLFLIVSFSVWGIGDIFRGNALKKAVATVGGTDISVLDLNRLFERALSQARREIAPDLTAEQARQMGFLDQALENEITRRLVDMDLRDRNIDVGPDVVLTMLAQEPNLRNEDGSFNVGLFQRILEQQRMSEEAFIEQMRRDTARQLLVGTLGSASFAPEIAVETLYKARAQKRVLDVVTIKASAQGGIPTPTKADLEAFYEAHQKLFEAPEYRGLTLGRLSVDTFLKDIVIPETTLKDAYEQRKESLRIPERRDIVQVVLQNEQQAQTLAEKAKKAGQLAGAAKAFDKTPVPLDKLERKNLMTSLSDAVFSLSEGEIGGPVKTQLGWHVMQLKKVWPSTIPSFTHAKKELEETLRRDQAIEAATRAVNRLDDLLAAGNSLDDIADDLRLRLIKIPEVDAKGQLEGGRTPSEFPYKERALVLAFSQETGETSPVEDDREGRYYVVRTDSVIPAGVRPFDEVSKDVALAWRKEKQGEKARALAQKILAGLEKGESLSTFARMPGVMTRQSAPLSLLGDTDKRLSTRVLEQAFRLKKGEAFLIDEGDTEVAIRVAKIEPGQEPSRDARRQAMVSQEFRKKESTEILDQYVRFLRTRYPVSVNRERLDFMRQNEE